MDKRDLAKHIDHTALQATTTKADLEKLCREAAAAGCASVCLPPSRVSEAKAYLNELKATTAVCTVIGFPLGYQSATIKLVEATQAIHDGADEIDVVINQGFVKDGAWEDVQNELTALRVATQDKILKVIIETCNMTEAEKIRLCEVVTAVGADYIKTSTGFGSAGAKLEDIDLFKQHIGPNVKIKAAGGIGTIAEMEAFIAAGAERLGSSRGLQALGLAEA